MGKPTPMLRIVALPGDGIGREIIPPALHLIDVLARRLGGFAISVEERLDCGAAYYAESGKDCSAEAFEAARRADAILLGAMGLPSIRLPSGTEVAPHLRMREAFALSAGVRPVKAFPNTPRRLLDERAQAIDFVVLRESSEGLFHTQGRGEVVDDREAREVLLITRPVTERLCDTAFAIARKRKARGGKGRVTCVDKANVFRAFAFFRKIFDERAAMHPDIRADHSYVDAMALELVRRPWEFDVLVMENMFGDILSDLGGGLVGGMGMAPCAELGPDHGLFQPAHGSAPDIAGQDKANPTATFLSAAMMLDWLSDRHGIPQLAEAAGLLERAIERAFAERRLRPMEFGGDQGLRAATAAVEEMLLQV
ncbi:MAG: isocitrate/isopropylmalate dehydrogenase family protein [Hyphomicrobiales bacterium]|nr:MAG: isocitrate/isopropylmalate dehydrogenase family protein [Hyphomicrobiales bacterium]